MKTLTKEDVKNIIERLLKTFLEAVVAYLVLALPKTSLDNETAIKTLVIGSVAAGVSAILNLVQTLLKEEE